MKLRKKLKKLHARQKDFDAGSQSREAKVQNRFENGGFHRPGSMSK